ncbi:MAG: hypothetical protein ACREJ3_08745, partial [Polyangiaceae bacterium]
AQIGGRAPEVIPNVGPDGRVNGIRRDDDGKPMTTQLSAEGEAQLARVAQKTGGTIVRAEHGSTGIDRIAKGLQRMMREELSEKVETVYADEYEWPLGAAVLLLIGEALLGEAPRRKRRAEAAPAKAARRPTGAGVTVVTLAGLLLCALLPSCAWDPSRPFERDSPRVKRAIAALNAGDAGAAASELEDYLSTGACKDGNIGTPDALAIRPDGTLDLGLSLFHLAEKYGHRFGQEEDRDGVTEASRAKRHAQVECARRAVQAIVDADGLPGDLRARAWYLEGNLAFLDGQYKDAVRAYDSALALVPGEVDAGDTVGRDAAYNRAIALRRIDDQKDAGPDAARDAGQDAGPDAARDGGDGPKDSGGGAPDGAGGGPDGGKHGGED